MEIKKRHFNNKVIHTYANKKSNDHSLLKKNKIDIELLFESFYERDIDKKILKSLNKIKFSIIKNDRILTYLKRENKIKEKVLKEKEKYYKKIKDKKLDEYFKDLEKEKQLYLEEKERIDKEEKEKVLYYRNIIKKIKKWDSSIKNINNLLEEFELDVNSINDNDISKKKEFKINQMINQLDFNLGLTKYFDNLRIENKNNNIQMFSFLSNSIFSLFENIEGEELFDPLIDIIFNEYSGRINEDNFLSYFNKIIENGDNISNFGEKLPNIDYNFTRDQLMGMKPIVFFNNNSYLYLFEKKGELYYCKYKSTTNNLQCGKIDKNISYKEFFKKFLFINEIPND